MNRSGVVVTNASLALRNSSFYLSTTGRACGFAEGDLLGVTDCAIAKTVAFEI